MSLPLYSIGQRSPRLHPRFKGWRHRIHLSMSDLAKHLCPSLIHYIVCNHKCLKTTNLRKQNTYQQLYPQTGAQLSCIRNSWPSEAGLLLLMRFPKAVSLGFSLNGLFTPKAQSEEYMQDNVGKNRTNSYWHYCFILLSERV